MTILRRIAHKLLAAAWNKDHLCRLIGLKPKPRLDVELASSASATESLAGVMVRLTGTNSQGTDQVQDD